MQYIILNGEKKPTEKLTDGGHPKELVADLPNLGVLISEPYVVLDFDSPSEAQVILRIVGELDLHCMVMKTTRGAHLWFKAPEPMKNSIKTRCVIGLHYDVRSYGKACYTVVKKDGQWREWLRAYPANELDDLPFWLRPLSFGKYNFNGMSDGDGRNQKLYEYILVMQSKGYDREQIREALHIINQFVFSEPLDDSEIATILRDESFRDESEIEIGTGEAGKYFDDEGKFKHDLFAHGLVNDLNVVTINEQCYIYREGYYQHADRLIDHKMIEVWPRIRKSQRAEVIDYVKILTTRKMNEIEKQEYIVNLKNTRLDLRTETLLPFDPGIINFSRIPVTYDPGAYCADLDKTLNKVFNHDREVIDLFEEMVGYGLIKNCRFRKGFLLYGGGSNGKSTVLNLLKKFFGDENTSTVEMEKLSEKFKTAELENKLVNIGDDINRREILDTGTLKKLFTGESVTVERKNQDPFTLKNYAKMIFSANKIPRIADKTHGMYSRLMLIPFTARFSADDADFDPFIEDKITTPEALSYLLNIALRGLRRLLHNNHFTTPSVVAGALEAYKTSNSTVLTWIEEESVEFKQLIGETTDVLFSDFKDWCARSDIKYQASIRTFHKEIEEKYNLERKRVSNKDTGGKFKWQFCVKLD